MSQGWTTIWRASGTESSRPLSIPENLGRVIPAKKQAVIELNSWPIPKIFRLIQRLGEIDHEDMYTTFNMGIGLILVIEAKEKDRLFKYLSKKKETAYQIGEEDNACGS